MGNAYFGLYVCTYGGGGNVFGQFEVRKQFLAHNIR